MAKEYNNRDLIGYGRELGKAEAYKYAFDKLIEVTKEQNKTVTEKYLDEPFSLDEN